MTLAEAHEIMRREVISLRHENERLKKGTYVSPEEKELKKLQSEIARLQKERDRYHRLWREKVESSSYYEEPSLESPLVIAQKREYESKIELLKEKVSGKFLTEESAEYFACIRTYAETWAVFKIFCKRANCDAQMIPGARGRAFG